MSNMNYEALDEALNYIEAVNEGVNTDLLKKSMSFRKDISAFNKEYRITIRNKEDDDRFNKARKLIDDFKSGTLKDYKEFVKGLDSSAVSDKIVGTIIGIIYTLGQNLSGLLAITMSIIGIKVDLFKADRDLYNILLGLNISTTVIKAAKDTSDDIEAFRDAYKDGGKEKSNYYITKCLAYADSIGKQLDSLKKVVDRIEAKLAAKNK